MVHSWDDLYLNSLNAKLIWIAKMHHGRVLLDAEIKLNFHSISSIKSIHWYPNQNFRKPEIFEIFGPDKSSVHSFSVFYNSAKICSNESKSYFRCCMKVTIKVSWNMPHYFLNKKIFNYICLFILWCVALDIKTCRNKNEWKSCKIKKYQKNQNLKGS